MNKNANSKKITLSLKNLEDAYLKLEEFCSKPRTTEIEQAGVIQAFEFTFETAWKTLQKFAFSQGLTVASPKQALQTALQLGFISEEDQIIWLEMLEDRNLTTHTYKRETAETVYKSIASKYREHLKLLLIQLKENVTD